MKYYLLVVMSMVAFISLSGCAGMPPPQEVVAETVGTVNQSSNIINNDIEPWMLGVIILLAGWAIPSPGEMFGGLFKAFGFIFGGIFGFIRRLF